LVDGKFSAENFIAAAYQDYKAAEQSARKRKHGSDWTPRWVTDARELRLFNIIFRAPEDHAKYVEDIERMAVLRRIGDKLIKERLTYDERLADLQRVGGIR
jgi:hypothetical protein